MKILIVRNDDQHDTIAMNTLCKDDIENNQRRESLDYVSTYPIILIPKKTPCANSMDITFWSD